MIVTASFVLGMLACSLKSARACLLAGAGLMVVTAAAGDWIQAGAAIGAYNMGIALALCGAIAVGFPRDQVK